MASLPDCVRLFTQPFDSSVQSQRLGLTAVDGTLTLSKGKYTLWNDGLVTVYLRSGSVAVVPASGDPIAAGFPLGPGGATQYSVDGDPEVMHGITTSSTSTLWAIRQGS